MGAQSTSGATPVLLPRELAEDAPGGGTTPRLLTESEAYAIAAAEVRRETAAKDDEIATLKSEKATVEQKLDTTEAAVATEKARADKAEQDLADERAKVETERAAAERKDSRVAAVKEAAAHLGDDYFTEDRKQRWANMDDEAFADTVKEIAELTKGLTATAPAAGGEGNQPPRQVAMEGQPAGGGDAPATGNAGKLLAFSRQGA